jgi:hypothetical protein
LYDLIAKGKRPFLDTSNLSDFYKFRVNLKGEREKGRGKRRKGRAKRGERKGERGERKGERSYRLLQHGVEPLGDFCSRLLQHGVE